MRVQVQEAREHSRYGDARPAGVELLPYSRAEGHVEVDHRSGAPRPVAQPRHVHEEVDDPGPGILRCGETESTASEACERGLRNRRGKRTCHGRIDGVAAEAKHRGSGLAGDHGPRGHRAAPRGS